MGNINPMDIIGVIRGIQGIREEARRPKLSQEGILGAVDILEKYREESFDPWRDDPGGVPALDYQGNQLPPIMTYTDALADIGRLIPPGSAEYNSFEDQVKDIRVHSRFQKNVDTIADALGLPVSVVKSMGVEGVASFLESEELPYMSSERTTGPGGEPWTKFRVRDRRTGDIFKESPGGPAVSLYGATGKLPYERSLEAGLGKADAARIDTGRKQRLAVKSFARSAARVSDIVGEGTDPQGRFRKIASATQSAVSQVGQGIRFMGVPLDKFTRSDPFPDLMATSVDNAKLRQHELQMAGAVAYMLDPSNADIERGQIKEALKYIKPIFTAGSVQTINAELRELTQILMDRYSDVNEGLIDGGVLMPLTVEEMPFLKGLMGVDRYIDEKGQAELDAGGVQVVPWSELSAQPQR